MESITLTATRRTPGKKSVRAVRKEMKIPVEIYGPGVKTNISAAVERKEMIKTLHTPQGKNVLISLDLEGTTILAIPYQFQIHPVKNNIQHIDFLAVNEDDEIEITVPVIKQGRSKGEIAGGRVMQVIKEVVVRCRPADIPADITIDITKNEIGDRIKISELPYPQGVTPVFRQDSPVIVINKGRGQTADELEEEEEEGTPEE